MAANQTNLPLEEKIPIDNGPTLLNLVLALLTPLKVIFALAGYQMEIRVSIRSLGWVGTDRTSHERLEWEFHGTTKVGGKLLFCRGWFHTHSRKGHILLVPPDKVSKYCDKF